jgi:hypothetical protein
MGKYKGLYRPVTKEGKLAEILVQSLQLIDGVRQELIAWELGQRDTALVHRASYQQLCTAITMLNRIPWNSTNISIPDGVWKYKDTTVSYNEYVLTDKRVNISRERRLLNAQEMAASVYLKLLELEVADTKFLTMLELITNTISAIDIPWRFERKPRRIK